jgi:hypothetical protein
MSTSQRLSRGFHRLGLFLAVIPLLVGGIIAIGSAIGEAVESGGYDPAAEWRNTPGL